MQKKNSQVYVRIKYIMLLYNKNSHTYFFVDKTKYIIQLNSAIYTLRLVYNFFKFTITHLCRPQQVKPCSLSMPPAHSCVHAFFDKTTAHVFNCKQLNFILAARAYSWNQNISQPICIWFFFLISIYAPINSGLSRRRASLSRALRWRVPRWQCPHFHERSWL